MQTKLPPRKIPAEVFAPRQDTIVVWLGMAGLLVNARGTILLIDPVITLIDQDGEKRSEHGYKLQMPFLPLSGRVSGAESGGAVAFVARMTAVLRSPLKDYRRAAATARRLPKCGRVR